MIEPGPASCARTRVVRYETGELAGADREEFASHLAGCARCKATLDELAADKRALAVQVPFGAFAAGIESRLGARRPRARWLRPVAWATLALGAAAAIAVVPGIVRDDTIYDGVKGGAPHLRFFVKTQAGARQGVDGEALSAGDALRLEAGANKKAYLMVLGVDADGKVYPWLAPDGRSAPAGVGKALLAGSVILDEDPRAERIYALASDEPLSLADVAEAARAAAAQGGVERLAKIPGVDAEQTSILIRKR